MPSKGIFGIGISIFFLGLILWGGWNVYQGLRKSFNEANEPVIIWLVNA